MSDQLVSIGKAARELGVSPSTIRRWFDCGQLEGCVTPGGHRRVYTRERISSTVTVLRPVPSSIEGA